MHLPRSLGTGLGQRLEKAPAVQVILEDGFAAVAAIHDVIDGIGVLDAKLAGHARRLQARAVWVNPQNLRFCGTDPFTSREGSCQ